MRIATVLVVSSLALHACDTGKPPTASRQPPTAGEGLVFVNEAAAELSFSATFHCLNAEKGTWHLIVKEGGDMAPLAFFTTDVAPGKFYESLKAIKARDGNNVTPANMGADDIATAGDAVDFIFAWKGQKDPVPLAGLLAEVVPDLPTSGGARGIDMRFGGNYTAEDAGSPPCHESGCLACLYTCSAGVTSNARANQALLKKDGNAYRYRLRDGIDLADGTKVRITVRRKI